MTDNKPLILPQRQRVASCRQLLPLSGFSDHPNSCGGRLGKNKKMASQGLSTESSFHTPLHRTFRLSSSLCLASCLHTLLNYSHRSHPCRRHRHHPRLCHRPHSPSLSLSLSPLSGPLPPPPAATTTTGSTIASQTLFLPPSQPPFPPLPQPQFLPQPRPMFPA